MFSAISYATLTTIALLGTPIASECSPVFNEATPIFATATPVDSEYTIARNRVLQGGTAVVTIDGVTYDCWRDANGTPLMQARTTCINGNCASTSRIIWR